MPPIPCALFPGSRPACPAGPTSKDDFEMLGCEFHGVFIHMRTNQDVIMQIIQMND